MRDHERATRRRTRSSLPTRLGSLSPAQPLPQHLYQVPLTAKTRTVLELLVWNSPRREGVLPAGDTGELERDVVSGGRVAGSACISRG
jgi:hypothetical protein